MQFVDTHTHIYLPEFDADRKEVVDRALDAGITKMVLPNVDLGTIGPMRRLASEYPENFSMAIGLHPTEVNQDWEKNLKVIYDELDAHSTEYIAIGEIGIDLYWDKTFRKEQMQVLEQQLKWAIERDLPVIIHCREGLNEVLDVMDSMNEVPVGVFHSFGGSIEDVRRIRKTGDFYFGINGIVTFKNSRLKDVLPEIGLDRILLETDAPYLAPVPHRGKRNETAFLRNTAEFIAGALGIDLETVAEVTSRNAGALFNL